MKTYDNKNDKQIFIDMCLRGEEEEEEENENKNVSQINILIRFF